VRKKNFGKKEWKRIKRDERGRELKGGKTRSVRRNRWFPGGHSADGVKRKMKNLKNLLSGRRGVGEEKKKRTSSTDSSFPVRGDGPVYVYTDRVVSRQQDRGKKGNREAPLWKKDNFLFEKERGQERTRKGRGGEAGRGAKRWGGWKKNTRGGPWEAREASVDKKGPRRGGEILTPQNCLKEVREGVKLYADS